MSFSTTLRVLGLPLYFFFLIISNFKEVERINHLCIFDLHFCFVWPCVCVFIYTVSNIVPITYKYFTIYILGIKVFSYITTVNYLNQEIRCWYDTITWIHSPYWNISVCPYYILYDRFLSSTESHIAFFFFFWSYPFSVL